MKAVKAMAAGLVVASAAGGVFMGVAAPQAVQAAPSLAVKPGAFAVDNVHSSVLFRIKHLSVAYNYGRFNTVSGEFLLDGTNPENSVLNVTVQAESVDTNNAGRDKHLRSQDFFSAKEFPTITFVGKSFKKGTGSTFEVTGDLTLRGVTKPVTVTIDDTGTGKGREGGEVAGLETRFTIKRSDFDVSYLVGPALADEVTLIVALEGGRK